MEQLNYSFFLLVLGDRLLKTDGHRSVHTLAGEAGCSRSVDGRADSCMLASRHPGNCWSLWSVCGGLVTPWCSDAFSWGPTVAHRCTHKIWNPARPCRLGHGQQTCAEVQSYRHDFFTKVISLHQPHVLPSLLLCDSLSKLMLFLFLLLPLVPVLPHSLKLLVWEVPLPSCEQGSQQGCHQSPAEERNLDAWCSVSAGGDFGLCWVKKCDTDVSYLRTTPGWW